MRIRKRRIPVLDLNRCTDCESCLVLCPSVFRKNRETGLIEVLESADCSEEALQEVISVCPADCIQWEEES